MDQFVRRGTESAGPVRMKDMGDGSFAEVVVLHTALYSAITDGSIATSGTAAPIVDTATPCSMVQVQCDPEAAANVLVGDADGQHWKLKPGDYTPPIYIDDANKVYVKAQSGTPTANFEIYA